MKPRMLIVATRDPRKTSNVGGVNTHLMVLFQLLNYNDWQYDVFTVRALKDIFKLRKYDFTNVDIVYLNISIYNIGIAKLILETFILKNIKIIVQFHGGRFSNLTFKPLYTYALKYCFKKITKFIVLNNEQLEELTTIFNSYMMLY